MIASSKHRGLSWAGVWDGDDAEPCSLRLLPLTSQAPSFCQASVLCFLSPCTLPLLSSSPGCFLPVPWDSFNSGAPPAGSPGGRKPLTPVCVSPPEIPCGVWSLTHCLRMPSVHQQQRDGTSSLNVRQKRRMRRTPGRTGSALPCVMRPTVKNRV